MFRAVVTRLSNTKSYFTMFTSAGATEIETPVVMIVPAIDFPPAPEITLKVAAAGSAVRPAPAGPVVSSWKALYDPFPLRIVGMKLFHLMADPDIAVTGLDSHEMSMS